MRRIISALIFIAFCGFITAQNQIEGSFYLFSNIGAIRMDIKPSSMVMSLYDSVNDDLNSVDYPFKEEYEKNGFYYVCYNDNPETRAVLKIGPEDSGNYGLYFVGDYKKESSNWDIPALKKEINRDTADVRIAKVYSEKNYNNYLKLKDNLTISDEDYVTFFGKYIDEVKNMVQRINTPDKKSLSQWFYHHPYIQMSIMSEQLIKLGYRPVTDPEVFVEKIIRDKHKQDLINNLKIDTNIFDL